MDTGEPAVFAFSRGRSNASLMAIHNFSEAPVVIEPGTLPGAGNGVLVDVLDGTTRTTAQPLELAALGVRWLVALPRAS